MKSLFRNWWLVTGLAALAGIVILALLLPIFMSSWRPLWVRLAWVGVVLLSWGTAGLWRRHRLRIAAQAIADQLDDPVRDENDALATRMREALAKLKDASAGKRDYLYSRPWYVIIGPPGAGKTTALLNSGLRFPVSDAALKGVGGTRNLDFWFADEAVLVDTAGRYTTQDSDRAVDEGGWRHFLTRMARIRPLQPINGVIVAIGIDEVLAGDVRAIDRHANAIRARLAEMRSALHVRVPVYLCLTKADLILGFEAFFADLDADGRRAVLGATLALDEADKQGVASSVTAQFDKLCGRMFERLPKRLQEETDPARRSLIQGFPTQMSSLRARVDRLVEGIAPASMPVPGSGLLRGIYLTSGVQFGSPLDRILGAVSHSYAVRDTSSMGVGKGRAYFINRLLGDVILAEPGLPQRDPHMLARQRLTTLGGMGALAFVTLAGLVLLGTSFGRNKALQLALLTDTQAIAQTTRASGIDLVEVSGSDPDFEQILPVLQALRSLPHGYADQKAGGPPLSMRFGLYQQGHARSAEQAYLVALQRILLPRLLLQAEKQLQRDAGQPMQLYQPLKAYLMLGGRGPLNRNAVRNWVIDNWETTSLAGPDRMDIRAQLVPHLDAMLADPQFGRIWPKGVAPLDGALIASSRATLGTLSLSERAYALLRQKTDILNRPAWRVAALMGTGDARAFANGAQLLQMEVPWLFTREGYRQGYQVSLQTVQVDLARDLWVFGKDAQTATTRAQMANAHSGIAALYARDYIAAWDTVVAAPQPADYFADVGAFGAFSKTPSAWKLLLLEARKNAMLPALGKAGGPSLPGGMQRLAAAQARVLPSQGVDAGQTIEAHFRPLAVFVGDGRAVAPIDGFIEAIRKAVSARSAADAIGAGSGSVAVQGQFATAIGDVVTSGVVAPPQLQPFITKAQQAGRGAATRSAQGAVTQEYAQSILPACRALVNDHYPFFGDARAEADNGAMLRVFGANGEIDRFVETRLKPLLDMSGPVWRWRSDDPVAASFDPSSAEHFQQAARIRDLIATGFTIRIVGAGFSRQVNSAEFSSGGVAQKLAAGGADIRPLTWNIGALPEAALILFDGNREVQRFGAQGVWALFRLIDAAQKENAGATAFRANFVRGEHSATFRIQLPGTDNPFGRGGIWSFRCPARL